MVTKDDIKVELVEMHADPAMHILETELFHGQRPRRPYHVRFLVKTMRDGNFMPGSAIHFARLGKRRYLINGQHTLAAIVEYRSPVLLMVHETTVETEDQISELYARHDRGIQRQISDGYNAYQLAQKLGISRGHVNDLGASIPLIVSGFQAFSYTSHGGTGFQFRDVDFRIEAIRLWSDEAKEFFEEISFSKSFIQGFLRRQAVMSVALVTYRYTGGDASEFWQEVARDNGLSAVHPAKKLIHFLIETPATRHSPRIYARYVAACWNAAFQERTISKVYARDAMLPIEIAGTPFTGKNFLSFIGDEGNLLIEPRIVREETADVA